MSEQTVKEYLLELAEKEGYGTDEEDLNWVLTEGKRVWSGEQDAHRWYMREEAVNEVGGRFIHFHDYIITGDDNMYDMDLHYNYDNMKFVEPKIRTIEETYYE